MPTTSGDCEPIEAPPARGVLNGAPHAVEAADQQPVPVPDITIDQLGWKPFFSRQLTAVDYEDRLPVRVMSVHRGMVTVMGSGITAPISPALPLPLGPEDRPTVGDWLLIDRGSQNIVRILKRTSLFKRPSPSDERRIQLIAANVDTLFIVTSCDQDFNVARLERYLVLAREVNVTAVIVLTKADLTPDTKHFVEAARALQPQLEVRRVDARDRVSVARLFDHCRLGETIALVGSSGVGKSTLVNTLTGSDSIATQPVRQTDGKGLHTTTVRQMHRLGHGSSASAWLIDTPGMRELALSEVRAGVAEVFDDIVALTLACKFTDCAHADEPGCAIRPAIAKGALDRIRLQRWRKLAGENGENTRIAAVMRARPRKTGKRK